MGSLILYILEKFSRRHHNNNTGHLLDLEYTLNNKFWLKILRIHSQVHINFLTLICLFNQCFKLYSENLNKNQRNLKLVIFLKNFLYLEKKKTQSKKIKVCQPKLLVMYGSRNLTALNRGLIKQHELALIHFCLTAF